MDHLRYAGHIILAYVYNSIIIMTLLVFPLVGMFFTNYILD